MRRLYVVLAALALIAVSLGQPATAGACERTQVPGACGLEHWIAIGSLK